MVESCTQVDCPHADQFDHCMVRTCENFRYGCPVHGTANR